MHPELFTLPGGFSIKTYGFFMMLGFLSGVWLAMRRAQRVKADPDVVLDMSFLCLLFGIGGARIFYVIHYWQTQFADQPNKLFAIIDVTKGGLEFLGGFLGAFFAVIGYALYRSRAGRPISLRLYMDILAPSAMWGLALGRLGCYFNGCCFGGLCVIPHSHDDSAAITHAQATPRFEWAVEFPYGSPAFVRQWEERRLTVPAELIVTNARSALPGLVPEHMLHMPVERRERAQRKYQQLTEAVAQAKKQGADEETTRKLEAELAAARSDAEAEAIAMYHLIHAQRFPSRVNPDRRTSVSELEHLASGLRTLPVHPTQLYAAINALILSGVLVALFNIRKRHGVVIGALFVMYPIPRLFEEMIRADNPTDVAGLTVSQSVSLLMIVAGAIGLYVLYKHLPERSRYAVPVPTTKE